MARAVSVLYHSYAGQVAEHARVETNHSCETRTSEMNKKLLKPVGRICAITVCAVLALAWTGTNAHAVYVIDGKVTDGKPTNLTQRYWLPENPPYGPANLDSATIQEITGYSPLFELYTANPNEAASGPYAASYVTDFAVDGAEAGSAADVTYVSGAPWVQNDPVILYVKDGNHAPIHYLIDISDWDGQESLQLRNFWLGGGSISHFTLLGGAAPVPEPASVAVWSALGLIFAMGAYRRWRRQV